jgi:choice-of-anchor A domain-containing protein
VGGSNTAQLTLNAGGSVFVGGSNTGQIHVNGGAGSVSVVGATTNGITLNNGGSVYAGGNSSGGHINVNGGSGAVSLNSSNNAQLTLNNGGTARIAGNTGNVNMNGGSLLYTGNVTGAVNLNGGATKTQVADAGITTPSAPTNNTPDFVSTFQAPMLALSADLDALTANSLATQVGNALTFNAAPDSGGRAVFDIESSVFAPNSTVTIDLNGATSVIINVNVDSCVAAVCALSMPNSLNFVNPTGYAETVLWNFVNATALAFPNEFGGSILAPYATVSNQTPIKGTLVAAGYNGNGELHSYPYRGSLGPSPIPDVPVPEPSSLLAIGAGLAGLAFLRRRRRL